MFATIYISKVNDWIRWLPAGVVWRPQNIPEVLSQGAEAGAHVKRKISDWALSLDLSYAYTNIKMVKATWAEDPAVGEQLAYQPKHSWRTKLMAANGTISLYGALKLYRDKDNH